MSESKEKYSPIGSNWEDVEKELYTVEEIEQSKIRVALIGEMIRARQETGISQKELERRSGVKQPNIARIELGEGNPTIDTVIKMLVPLGKTIAVVPLNEGKP